MTPILFMGCVNSGAVNNKEEQIAPDYFYAKRGDNIKEVSFDLAKKYKLRAIELGSANLNNVKLQLPIKIDITTTSVQKAFDLLYEQTSYLTNVDQSNIMAISRFGVVDPNKNYEVITEDKPKPKPIDYDALIIASQKIDAGEGKSKTIKIEKDKELKVKSISKQQIKPKKRIIKNKKLKPMNTYKLITSNTYIDSLRKYLRKEKYTIFWSIEDVEMSEKLHEKPSESINVKAENVIVFTREIVEKLNKASILDSTHKLYALFDQAKKTVIFHQNSSPYDVQIFNVKAGTLSSNVQRLASSYGWTLNMKTGWLASKDYNISVNFPLITKPDIGDAVTKLLERYKLIKPKLMEATKTVYVIDSNK